jgi:superfamily II DNA or RNA helicase
MKMDVKAASPKQCTSRISRHYPNRWSREELVDKVHQELGITKAKARKMKISDLCKSLNIPYIIVPKEEKKEERKEEKQRFAAPFDDEVVKSDRKYNAGQSDCVSRSKMPMKKHQLAVVKHLNDHRGLLAIHSTGAGKTLTSVAASQCYLDKHPNRKVIVVTPVSLQENFKKEMIAYGAEIDDRYEFYTIQGFVTKDVMCRKSMLIIDEVHNLRTEIRKSRSGKLTGAYAQALVDCAKKADRVLLLTATPIVNGLHDLANPMAMIDGKKPMTKSEFQKIFAEGSNSLANYMEGKISMYKPDEKATAKYYPRSNKNDIFIPMSSMFEKSYDDLQNLELDKLPAALGDGDLAAFFNGVRRGINSLDLCESPKVEWIMKHISKSNREDKYVIFSHFIDCGLQLLINQLNLHDISFERIDGSLSMKKRKEIVDKYNSNQIKVLLISKAGGEGLDLKETRNIIIMEPAWNEAAHEQIIGRGIRFMSHYHLPEERQIVDVYRLFLVRRDEYKNIDELKNVDFRTHIKENPGMSFPSIDIFLRNMAIVKKKKIDRILDRIRPYSIEAVENDIAEISEYTRKIKDERLARQLKNLMDMPDRNEAESIMKRLLRNDFEQDIKSMKSLVRTRDTTIFVDIADDDNYWGRGRDDKGENKLGKIHMELRELFRKRLRRQKERK